MRTRDIESQRRRAEKEAKYYSLNAKLAEIPEFDYSDFGTRLAEFRRKHHFNQEEMAIFLDISKDAYRQYEYGKTKLTVDKLYLLSQLFDTPLEYFFN